MSKPETGENRAQYCFVLNRHGRGGAEQRFVRYLKFTSPHLYANQIMFEDDPDTLQGWIVNGQMKLDIDELTPKFLVHKIKNTNVFIGSFPETEDNIF